jgi:hypothetical protein
MKREKEALLATASEARRQQGDSQTAPHHGYETRRKRNPDSAQFDLKKKKARAGVSSSDAAVRPARCTPGAGTT